MSSRLRDAWAVLRGHKYATTYKITVHNGTMLIESPEPLSPQQAAALREACDRPAVPPYREAGWDWGW